jgi:predicted transposase YbfD/YdcC
MSSHSTRVQDHFSDLTDPRRRKVVYPLINIVTIAVCAVIAGADDFVSIAAWGGEKRDWLATILDLSSGIPSHDRFNAIFAALNPAEFEKCLLSWITALHEITSGQVVAIDGKTLRGSFDKASGKSAIHMVSAWATANHITLGQVVVDAKSNEITAIPKLLELLEISGSIVTIDAMGCQTAIAEAIVAKKADYVLAVKENQGNLLTEVKDSFAMLGADAVIEEVDCGHGRVEQRKCSVIGDLSLVEKAAEWASLQGLVRIEAERYHKATGKTEREIRYYITSLKPDAAQLNRVIRQHWGIENKLHWVLDVGFGEDLSRKRTGHAAQNFSLLNRIALNILKQEKTSPRGIKGKRLKAAWDHPYLLKLLGI